ncbi:NAD(P)H-hydrate dehydratase [Coraliomargarita sp. SDUM461004]|uniref:ADP-dependent (S)-NAD(P)H-hydrate dehydratase n=1 Tax=Thalassobacterium sedimentorum TaxID=3041258 RepID=A0ABU1AI63_9BACT|nr:NAD(P)H-hydrate dehydratase [Coraliomargarita sp. SDUM461004]MDQ8193476.1 NAD(P)H-hydrate dehydratase [Coraliomargarita sp. SDUM461004]
MKVLPYAHPVLSCQQAKDLEFSVLTDASAEWSAMQQAGAGIAKSVIEDYQELRSVPEHLRILALIGKGNNGGDALLACGQLLADYPRAQVDLILTSPADELRPLAARALQELEGRVQIRQISEACGLSEISQMLVELGGEIGFHICIDGLLGMSFVPPLRAPVCDLIEAINAFEGIELRASVDLPSGAGDGVEPDALILRADFSYATGIAKKPLFAGWGTCGRVRYVDLGFFKTTPGQVVEAEEAILTDAVLAPLRRLRPANVDKRSFGHLFIVGGSARMPGALLMSVRAAVSSGVGLVTAFAPSSVTAVLAAQVPEAMWISWPETSLGTLSPSGMSLILERIDQATAVIAGPGFGADASTEMVAQEIVKLVECPLLLDADALRVSVLEPVRMRQEAYGRVVLTPHMGEFMRVAKLEEPDYTNDVLLDFSKSHGVVTVLKGPQTRICNGASVIYHTQGGPVLARGGSGDLLTGLIGGMLAQNAHREEEAVAQGLYLHGLAAQCLARVHGQVSVHTTQLLDYLSAVLRT